MIIQYRNILSFIYILSLIVCFICNIATSHGLSWFFIVLTSEMVAMSLTLVPVLISEKKGLGTLGAFIISLSLLLITCNLYTGGAWFFIAFFSVMLGITLVFLPFVLHDIWLPGYWKDKKTLIYFLIETLLLIILLFICNFYSGGGWFLKTALPITLFSLIIPWGMMIIIRYFKINKFYKAAGCLVLLSMFEYSVEGVINRILKEGAYDIGIRFNFLDWSEDAIDGNIRMIILILLLILTVIFTSLGTMMASKKEVRKPAK